jgi:MYXO-CTERM domain-containing protein
VEGPSGGKTVALNLATLGHLAGARRRNTV